MIIKTTDEIRQHIGVVADNEFDILIPFLKRSRRYVINVIGKATYAAALAHYKSDDYRNVNADDYEPVDEDSGRLDVLVDHLQDALVYYAHHLYSPEANVIMTDSGFRVPWTDSVRPAQEWQVKGVVASMLDSAHELVDELLIYLDENEDNFDFWDSSEEIQENRARFINSALQFSDFFDIKNSRRIFLMLKPIISEFERKRILPVIGQERYDDIHKEIVDEDITAPNQLILDRIQPALAFFVIYTAIKRLPKEELSSISNNDPKDIQETAFSELQFLENYITKLDNELLPDDEKEPETFEPLLDISDEDLESQKSISV